MSIPRLDIGEGYDQTSWFTGRKLVKICPSMDRYRDDRAQEREVRDAYERQACERRRTNHATHYERRHVLVLNTKTRQNSKTLYFGPNFWPTHFNSILLHQIMPITNEEIEECVIKACESFEKQKNPKITETARKYGVYKDRVRRRFRGIAGPSYNKRGHNKRLINNEDKALYLYIDFAENIGLLIREKTFIAAANLILRSRYENSSPVS
jgi:hypothetical protein